MKKDAFCQGKAVKINSSDAFLRDAAEKALGQVRETPSCESLLDIRSGLLCTFNTFAIVFICTCDR